MKNKLFLIMALFLSASLSSCKKFLDVQPKSSISTNEFYKNDAEVGSGVVACYDGLQKLYNIDFILTEIRSDNTTTFNSEGVYYLIDYFQDGPSSNVIADQYWQISYNTIYRTNTVLANLKQVTSNSLKVQYEGEARFIRALNYFNLVRLFGAVPLVTHIIYDNDQAAFARVPVDVVYDTIIQDFQIAAKKLPMSYSSNDEGRATKGAAIGMLAKVYLTLHRYSNARLLLEELMKPPYNYALMENYHDIFYKEMNQEILFAVRYKSGAAGEGETFSGEMTHFGKYVRGNNPTKSLLQAYQPGGIRYTASVFIDNAGSKLCGKYLSSAPLDDGGNDWIVLRYADVLLMYAEVTNEISGPTQEGLNAFNQVRSRAGLSTYSVSDFTQDSFRQAIYKERRVELAFEDHRWFDLLRTGEVDSVMTAQGSQLGFTFENFRKIYAIPLREIDVSNGVLTQNPGY